MALVAMLMLFGSLCLKSENTICLSVRTTKVIENTDIHQTEFFPYYPFFAEI